MFDTPELLIGTSIGRNGSHLLVGSSGECTVGTLDGDLEVGIAEITTSLIDGSDGPTLVRTVHVVTDASRDVTCGPCGLHLIECLVSNGFDGLLHLVAVEPTLTLLLHTNEIDSEFEGIATALAEDCQIATLEIVASDRPAILPYYRTDGKCGTSAEFEVCLPVERHHFDTLVKNVTSEVSSTAGTLLSSNDHLAATVEHVTANIVEIRSFDTTRTAYYNIIGRVNTVATSAVSAEQVIPTVAVDEVRGLAVDGDILLLVAADTKSRLRVELDEADGAEISTVTDPQTTCGGVQKHARVDGVLILHTVRGADLYRLRPLEVGRLGVEGLVPHGEDAASMATAKTTTSGSVDAEVTVADLQNVGSCTTTGTVGTAMPAPAVV